MCVTSNTDVLLPSVSDFILMLLNKSTDFTHTVWCKPVLHSQFDLRLKPELGVPIYSFDVHMRAALFHGEK